MTSKTEIEYDLQKTSDILILNGTLTESPGLIHGKTGIAIFFFHYSQYTKNLLFADYAMDIIYEIQNQIHSNSLANYENGIAGIGVGIDYLIQNNFLTSEDDIYEDIDERMYRAVMYDPWQSFNMYDGLTGYGRYWIMRLGYQSPSKYAKECLTHIIIKIKDNLSNISPDEQTDIYCFLHDLQKTSSFSNCTDILKQCYKWDLFSSKHINRYFPHLKNHIIGNKARIIKYYNYFTNPQHNDNINNNFYLDTEISPKSMGILDGFAGKGLLQLTTLNSLNTRWMQLL